MSYIWQNCQLHNCSQQHYLLSPKIHFFIIILFLQHSLIICGNLAFSFATCSSRISIKWGCFSKVSFLGPFLALFHLQGPKSALNIDLRQTMNILPLYSVKIWPFMCIRPFMKIYISCTFWPPKLKILQKLGKKIRKRCIFQLFFYVYLWSQCCINYFQIWQ